METKESRYYIAGIINDAKENIENRVKTYNEKYVKKQVEKGREFITELKADPVKTIDDLIYDSRDAFEKMRSARMEALQKKAGTAKKDIREKIEKMNQKIRPVYKGIENDAKLIAEDFIAQGKQKLDRMPMKKSIEKQISAGVDAMDAIPSKLNLPSKTEIDNLVSGIAGISKKVDALNRQYAGA